MKLSCPACGAEVDFKSRSSVFSVCSFCQSTLVRSDLNLESLGKMSDLPPDLSPIQIGTQGRFDQTFFEVVGRQRIGWESGSWNEWFIHFEDGRDGWMADAQGLYMMSFQVEGEPLPELSKLKISDTVQLKSGAFNVQDIRHVSCIGSQGELPVQGVAGRTSTSVDLVGKNEVFANLDYSPGENRLFVGRYVEFDDLKFSNLKEFDGW